jgi:SPP1 family predicted phage head-tail adaptor
MVVSGAGNLDKRIRFERRTVVTDEFGGEGESGWSALFTVWANKQDLSDGEKFAAGERSATISTRFIVRYSLQVAGVTPKDRIVYDSVEYEITGKKETNHGRDRFVEFSVAARADDGA